MRLFTYYLFFLFTPTISAHTGHGAHPGHAHQEGLVADLLNFFFSNADHLLAMLAVGILVGLALTHLRRPS